MNIIQTWLIGNVSVYFRYSWSICISGQSSAFCFGTKLIIRIHKYLRKRKYTHSHTYVNIKNLQDTREQKKKNSDARTIYTEIKSTKWNERLVCENFVSTFGWMTTSSPLKENQHTILSELNRCRTESEEKRQRAKIYEGNTPNAFVQMR